jgi:hypothetical protein
MSGSGSVLATLLALVLSTVGGWRGLPGQRLEPVDDRDAGAFIDGYVAIVNQAIDSSGGFLPGLAAGASHFADAWPLQSHVGVIASVRTLPPCGPRLGQARGPRAPSDVRC